MHIRPAYAADTPALLQLERQCSTAAHWSRQQYEDIFLAGPDGPSRLVLMVEEEAADQSTPLDSDRIPSSILGFLVAHPIGGDWELENIAVAPASRRKGLATQLLSALLTRARETNSESVFLEVRESNQAARSLYARLGFEETGRRKLYYANPPEDAVLYRFAFSPPPD